MRCGYKTRRGGHVEPWVHIYCVVWLYITTSEDGHTTVSEDWTISITSGGVVSRVQTGVCRANATWLDTREVSCPKQTTLHHSPKVFGSCGRGDWCMLTQTMARVPEPRRTRG